MAEMETSLHELGCKEDSNLSSGSVHGHCLQYVLREVQILSAAEN